MEYYVEIAPSNRTSCDMVIRETPYKLCKKKINKGDIRLVKKTPSGRWFDYKYYCQMCGIEHLRNEKREYDKMIGKLEEFELPEKPKKALLK